MVDEGSTSFASKITVDLLVAQIYRDAGDIDTYLEELYDISEFVDGLGLVELHRQIEEEISRY